MIHHMPCLCRDIAVALRLPIHNFVNGLDVMPWLLDSARIQALLTAVQPVLPSSLQRILDQKAHVPGSFVPIGNTYMLLGNHIRVSTWNRPDQVTPIAHLFEMVAASVDTSAAQDSVMMRAMHDHLPNGYSTNLQDAVMCCVPILFMGGTMDSYEAVRIKRMSVGNAAPLILHTSVPDNCCYPSKVKYQHLRGRHRSSFPNIVQLDCQSCRVN